MGSVVPSYGQDSADHHEQRRKARDEKTREYCIYMDSLIRSHVYVFKPRSMQLQPAGRNQQIMNVNFRMDVRDDYIDIYLPYIVSNPGYAPRTTVLNNTLPYVPEYTAQQSADGTEWTVNFSSSLFGPDTYTFTLTVTTCTGDAKLDIRSSRNYTVTYSGYLTDYR